MIFFRSNFGGKKISDQNVAAIKMSARADELNILGNFFCN